MRRGVFITIETTYASDFFFTPLDIDILFHYLQSIVCKQSRYRDKLISSHDTVINEEEAQHEY